MNIIKHNLKLSKVYLKLLLCAFNYETQWINQCTIE